MPRKTELKTNKKSIVNFSFTSRFSNLNTKSILMIIENINI